MTLVAVVLAIVLALGLAVFLRFVRGTMVDMHQQNEARREFAQMVAGGLSPHDALIELSQKRHPELPRHVHECIVAKFGDSDRLTMFMLQAVDFGSRRKQEAACVLALVETTELVPKGHGVYSAKIDHHRFRELHRAAAQPCASTPAESQERSQT